MRPSMLLALAPLTLVYLTGCASLGPVKKMKHVAVVSVYMGSEVKPPATKQEGDLGDIKATFSFTKALVKGEGLNKAIEKAIHRPRTVAEAAPAIITEANACLPLMPDSLVIGNAAYQALPRPLPPGGLFDLSVTEITKEGWRIVHFDYGNNGEGKLAEAVGADGLVFVKATCGWDLTGLPVNNSGKAKGWTNLDLHVVSPDGKKLHWTTSLTERSDSSVWVVDGAYKEEEMDKLLVESYRKASLKAFAKLKKELDKTKS